MHQAPWIFLSFLCFLVACGGGEDPGISDDPAKPAMTLAEVEQRIIANPNDPALFAQRALFHEAMDSLRLAENDWRRTIVLDSANAKWRIALGDLYFRKIMLPQAEERFSEAIALAPDSIEGRSKLSEVYLMQLRFKEAMSVANEALRIDPLNAKLYNLKGWIHRTAGDTALAISSYQTAVERDPTYYDAYVSLGLLHAAKNDPLAMQYYNSALEVRPNSVEALYNKAIYAQEHDADSVALVCYASIKEVEPNYPLAFYNTGFIYLEHQRKTKEARAEFRHAIDLLPDYTQAYFNRGLTYELDGLLDSALADYQQVLKLDPGNTDAAKGLSRLQTKGLRVKLR